MTLLQVTLLGRVAFSKAGEFSEKFQMVGWGGVIFNSKSNVADFGPLERTF